VPPLVGMGLLLQVLAAMPPPPLFLLPLLRRLL
jgi:hypothetical protein